MLDAIISCIVSICSSSSESILNQVSVILTRQRSRASFEGICPGSWSLGYNSARTGSGTNMQFILRSAHAVCKHTGRRLARWMNGRVYLRSSVGWITQKCLRLPVFVAWWWWWCVCVSLSLPVCARAAVFFVSACMQSVLMCGCINSFVCWKAVTWEAFQHLWKIIFIYTKHEGIQCQQEHSMWQHNALNTFFIV